MKDKKIEQLIVDYLIINGPSRAHKMSWDIPKFNSKDIHLNKISYICSKSDYIVKLQDNSKFGAIWGINKNEINLIRKGISSSNKKAKI